MQRNSYRELRFWEEFWRQESKNFEYEPDPVVYKTREEAAEASKARWRRPK